MIAIADEIWNMKYKFTGETRVEDTWRRIAKDLSQNEPEYEDQFYSALEDFKFLPAGRITAGAGTERDVTLFNCFVMGTVPDSMSGIFDMLKEAALTMQQGGGIGYDFSTIRPKGAQVLGVAADASGPLTFMDCWDSMCRTVMSAGTRRGAMMATMRCDHPDIEQFITAKKDPARLRMFNMSVLATDPFMEAVKSNDSWDLVFEGQIYRTVKARDLWDTIMGSTYAQAEPGVIFIDRINKTNNLRYCETIAATNPCGEQPLPPYGACLLGSINFAALIENAFQKNAGLDHSELEELVATAVRMMDNVVDVSNFPLEAQRVEAVNKRRIGLGVTGLADALAMCRLTYGSEAAVARTGVWMSLIAKAAYRASIELAKEKGAFPLFDSVQYVVDPKLGLDEEIRTHGIRNALLTSIAPTGTISLYAGNVSSGIEPVFAHSYTRKVIQKDGSKTEQLVEDYAVSLFKQKYPDEPLPDYFVSAQTLSPEDHLKMQAVAQGWVDSSISKTINCPEDISFDDFKDIYMRAYDTGCKGCTTYRPNDVTGSVLSVEPEKPKRALKERGKVLKGMTYKMAWPELPHAFYVTVNDDEEGNPFEVFIQTQNVEAQAWITALTRMISAVYRRGGDINFVHQELEQIFDPRGGAWIEGTYVKSLIAAIGRVLAGHMGQEIGTGAPCPSCAENTLINQSGCPTCTSCGFSKCG